MDRKERTLAVALALSFVLVTCQGLLAYFSGSLALKAEAWHVFADLIVGGVTLASMRLARREKDVARTGISLVENVVAILIGLFILYVGFDIVRSVSQEPPELRNLGWVIAGSVFTIGLAWVIARYERYVGHETGSPILIASAHHDMLDVYVHVIVLIGLIGAALGFTNLDQLAALLVALFVAYSSYEVLSLGIVGLRKRRSLLETQERALSGDRRPSRARPRLGILLPVATIIVLVFYILSGFYTVAPDEKVVVRRFGDVTATMGPGLHYRLPWPIERLDRVFVSQIRRVELPATLMLTGDENLVVSRLGVHYIVENPQGYLFNQHDPVILVSKAAEAAIRRVTAEVPVDAILTGQKAQIEKQTAAVIQATLNAYNSGMKVVDVQLLESSPPPEVADAFRDVASAREDMNTYINEARAYENQEIALARGQSSQAVEAAQVYWIEKTSGALEESIRFLFRRHAYLERPAVTRERLYLEAVEQILSGAQKYLVDPGIQLIETDLWFTEALNSAPESGE